MTPKQLVQLLKDALISGERILMILSGPRGSGKTSFCEEVVANAQTSGLDVGGLVCPAVSENGANTFIQQMDIEKQEMRQLGRRSIETESSTIGQWMFDDTVLDWGNQVLSGLGNKDLIVIDEIGPLELVRGRGYRQAMRLLDAGSFRTALVVVRPSLLQTAKERWPYAWVLGDEIL